MEPSSCCVSGLATVTGCSEFRTHPPHSIALNCSSSHRASWRGALEVLSLCLIVTMRCSESVI